MSQNVRIRRGRSSTASSVNRNLVNVTAPPPIFPAASPGVSPSTPGGQAAFGGGPDRHDGTLTAEPTPAEGPSIAQRRGVDPTGEQLRVSQLPLDAIREGPTQRRGSVTLTPELTTKRPPGPTRRGTAATASPAGADAAAGGRRAPPRARSRTINSIFSTGSASTPGVSTPSHRHGGAFEFSRTASPTEVNTGGRRRSSVSSSHSDGPPGVPVTLQLPPEEAASPGRRRGTLESMLDEESAIGGRPRSSSRATATQGALVPAPRLAKVDSSDGTEPDEDHPAEVGEDHHDAIVDHLDCIDPTVSFVSHLQNVSSSILLPGFMSSRAVLSIPHLVTIPSEVELQDSQKLLPPATTPKRLTELGQVVSTPPLDGSPSRRPSDASAAGRRVPGTRRSSVAAPPNIGRPRAGTTTSSRRPRRGSTATYVTLPHEDPLDAHVVDVLTKRQKFKRAMKGLGKFLLTPLGVFFFFYGIAVVFWGAAIVFFLAKWIPVKDTYTNDLWVEISSQVVNGLFTITGVGLFPQRILDSWRIFTIWRLQRLTLKRLRERGLPCPANADDLPDPLLDKDFVPVLSQKQQDLLRRQQEKFSASQTWYRPHETDTHRAFPIRLALLNTLFMVGNSAFQCMLCGTMWALSAYSGGRILLRMGTLRTRPPWTTGCLIPASFLCGIAAAVIVWRGGQKTKKVEEVEEKLKGALGIEEVDGEDADEDDEDGKPGQNDEARHGSPRAVEDGEKTAAAADDDERAPAAVGLGLHAGGRAGRSRRSLDERDEDEDVVGAVKATI